MNISATEIQTYLACRRKWNYTSLNRMSLEPKSPQKALSLGIGVHEALESYYRDRVDPVEFFRDWAYGESERLYSYNLTSEEMDDLRAAWDLGLGMLENYVQWSKANDNFDFIAAEQQFKVPIFSPDGVVVGYFVGRFDGLIRFHDSGEVAVIDHKTFSVRPQSADWLQLDLQTTGYAYSATYLAQAGQLIDFGVPEGGVISKVLWNGLRKKLPTVPATLKNGSLSRAANMDTTLEVYLNAIHLAGEDERDYEEVLERLRNKPNNFFHREIRERTWDEMLSFETLLYQVHQEMANPETAITYNPTHDCLWKCSFRAPCIAKNCGGDEQMQLQIHYASRPEKGEVYSDDEVEA